MSDSAAKTAIVEKFWTSISTRNVDGYLACFAADAVANDPVDKPPLRSTEDRRAYIEGLFSAFSTVTAKIDFTTVCGDFTATKWTVDAVTPAGEDVRLEGIDTCHHAPDGLIRELNGFF